MSAAPGMDRLAIARALREAGMMLGLERENRFRARAFARASRALEALTGDVDRLVAQKRLTQIPGIGPAIASVISDLHATGESKFLQELRARVAPGAVELAHVPGMTPRRLAALQAALSIQSVPELRAACEEGLVRAVKGFGEATERRILEAVKRYETRDERILLVRALETAESFRDFIRGIRGCESVAITGSVRRRRELVSNVDLVAAFAGGEGRGAEIAHHPLVARMEHESPGFIALSLADGARVRVTIARRAEFCETLHRTTGSAAHLQKLEELGRSGARRRAAIGSGQTAAGAPCLDEERRIYAGFGLPWIPPELREDVGEIEAGLAGATFEDLVQASDIQGMVHCHTTHSDGRNTIEEMARAAERMGMKYITITDHSPTASYAGGLTPERLERQWAEIDEVQQRVGIRILKGTESDILADGSLDYPPSILERFEVVIASVHNRHRMTEAEMTRRLVRAMRLPVFKIWGHALGRLLQRREPFACRVETVLDAIADSRAAVEINGDPHRLDLEPRWIREARKRNLAFVVSTDAHSVRELENVAFGIDIARRGGVRTAEVLNARPADAFAEAVRPA